MLKDLMNRKSQILFAAIICLFSANSFAQNSDNTSNANDPSISNKIRDITSELKQKKSALLNSAQQKMTDVVGLKKGEVEDSALAKEIEQKISKNLYRQRNLKSLMFSPKQEADINAVIDALRNGKEYLPEIVTEVKEEIVEEQIINRKSYIHLSSIMYYDVNHWSIWINGEKISSESNRPENELFLESVKKDKVIILWTISATKWRILLGRKSEFFEDKINANNQVEAKFELQPNQTYLLVDDVVVEGYAVN